MKDRLNTLLEEIKGMGYKDYIISHSNDNIIIKLTNTNEMGVNQKELLIREFKIRIEETSDSIILIY